MVRPGVEVEVGDNTVGLRGSEQLIMTNRIAALNNQGEVEEKWFIV